jgi:hypothetical protein
MFNADRWAEAFFTACEKDGEDPSFGLDFLEAVLPLAEKLSGMSPGTGTADRFATVVEKAAQEMAITGINAATALVWLFMRREGGGRGMGKSARLTAAISDLLDKKRGVLRVVLEAADTNETDERFLRDFEAALAKKHGVKTVSVETKANPELLSGYRWTIDGERTDCSLAGRLSEMERWLKA